MPIVTLDDGEVRDEIRQPIYDTIEFRNPETLAGKRLFFQSLTGPDAVTGAQVPKSLAKTNMPSLGSAAGSLAVATSYRCQGLCFDASNNLDGANAALLPVILERGSINFHVGQKDYWQGPARFATGRMVTELSGSTQVIYQQYGWSSIQPIVFRGHHVIDINAIQNFLVTLEIQAQDLTAAERVETPAVGSDMSLVFSLKGLLRRPVQ
jgi:hypothetical protein